MSRTNREAEEDLAAPFLHSYPRLSEAHVGHRFGSIPEASINRDWGWASAGEQQSMSTFAHLHVHTEYSLPDGYSRIQKLVREAKAQGMDSLAITDHGNMYGVLEFCKACMNEGIIPIIGVEAYLAEDRNDRSQGYGDDYRHLLLLAENAIGYANLLELTTIANTQGWHGNRPRIDKRDLEAHAEGLFVTSSCLSGEIPRLFEKGKRKEAYDAACWYRDVFGPDHFYLELQEHFDVDVQGRLSQTELNQLLYQMHRDLDIPMIVTNDLHYVGEGDADAHDLLLCVRNGMKLRDPRRWRFQSRQYYLKSPEEMARLFPSLPDALTNTVRIAERCRVNPWANIATLPDYPIPSGYQGASDYLYALCLQGVRERFGELTERIKLRLDYEFGVINGKGFTPYMLIVWDFVHYARSQGIRCCARGSAAGSLLAYVLGITNVDPLRTNLLFERFFNPDRADMPDVDIDFPDDQREVVFEYVVRKYGAAFVAQMVTFNTLAARASVKDAARVMGLPTVGDRILRTFPPNFKGRLSDACAESADLSRLYQQNREARNVIEHARRLEGSVRGTGRHAAGVVIGNAPLSRFVPLEARVHKEPGRGQMTQYEQAHLEDLGLIKFDFLGLINLSILRDAVRFIKQTQDESIDLDTLSLDPVEDDDEYNVKRKRAFDLLASGETTGVFQLESQKMREYIKQLRPSSIEDVTAMVALYRPGPMDSIPSFIDAKHGSKSVSYLDERLGKWLGESYGTIVYQDQVLLIARHLACMSWEKVNKLRKALSKKKMDEVEHYREEFVAGCVSNGMREETAGALFTQIQPFGGYGFNKAHAASYAVVAYHCAYLKANYPTEFMAATLTAHASDTKKMARDIAECRRMGITVLGPDVNRSERGFTVEAGGVRFGLLAIKGIGEGPVGEILRERSRGPFTRLSDFCVRLDPKQVSRGVIETLIKVGALDTQAQGQRHQLLAALPDAMKWAKVERLSRERGLLTLFGDLEASSNSAFSFSSLGHAKAFTHAEILELEHQLLGVYVSGHPLEDRTPVLSAWVTATTSQLSEAFSRKTVSIGGLLTEVHPITTKKGDQMCTAILEDLEGSVGVTVFPQTYTATSALWKEGSIVLVEGLVQVERDDETGDTRETRMICRKAVGFEALASARDRERYHISLTIQGSLAGTGTEAMDRLHGTLLEVKQRLQSAHGSDQYDIIVEGDIWRAVLVPAEHTTHYSHELVQDLIRLLGNVAVTVQPVATTFGEYPPV
jgi:DNA polymerase III subunit alpha